MFERIAKECSNILKKSHCVILGAREVQTATRLVIPGDLCRHAISEGGKAMAKYFNHDDSAGLVFSINLIHRLLRAGRYACHVQNGAPIFLTGVIEYLNAEILELSGNVARDKKKERISPRDIMLAVRFDEEINQLLSTVIFSSAGVVPHIHKKLLVDRRRSKKQSQSPPKE